MKRDVTNGGLDPTEAGSAVGGVAPLRDAYAALLETKDFPSLYAAIVTQGAQLLGCHAAILWLVDPPGRYLYRAAATGLEGRTDGYMRTLPLNDTLEGKVLATGEHAAGMLIESRAAAYRPLLGAGLRAGLSCPVRSDGGPAVGVLSFLSQGMPFGPSERAVADAFSAAAGNVLKDLGRREERRRVASLLRDARLPPAVPAMPGLDVWVEVAAGEGSDADGHTFYDILETDGGFAICYGQLSGKGSREDGFALMTKASLREGALVDPSPPWVVACLNRFVCETFGQELFVGLVYALFDPASKMLTLAAGGSWPPVLVRSGKAVPLEANGALLGAYEDERYPPVSVALRPGDSVVGYTDAIPEAWSGVGSRPMDRVRAGLERHAREELRSLIKNLVIEAGRASPRPVLAGSVAVGLRVARG